MIVSSAIFAVMIQNSNSNNLLTANSTANVSSTTADKFHKRKGTSFAGSSARIIEQAFEVFDKKGKGYISGDDLGRVISETTDVVVDENSKNIYVDAVLEKESEEESSSSSLSSSSSSSLSSSSSSKSTRTKKAKKVRAAERL